MAITKEKKKEIYKKVQKAIKDSESMVFVNFHGLTVSETTELRKGLRSESIGYTVAKKTVIKRALEDSKTKGDIPVLDGELAVAYGEDLIAPARGVNEFKKTHKDSIDILGGIFEGAYMNKEEMLEIATIPVVPVLRGMFVNVINSPIQRFVIALSKIAETKEA
ncbi:MAG: 50S ribosomal protein L10 [Candidatus Pacebacteria bacterium]|nr:50S ribosomal protein L10 [Candidatus Paceibacterota bacterium]